jgi:branched-chain amino acid aminotransferase
VVSGLFETIRVRAGRAPFLERHLARMAASTAALGRPGPEPGLAQRVLARGGDGDMVVRATLSDRGERIEPRPVPPEAPMRIVFSGTRHEPYPHKTTDREMFDRARSRVVPYRADEVILLTGDGILAEGCVTNVFFWLGSELCTPSLDLGILPGIGRSRVLQLAAERGIHVREGHFRRAEVEGLPLFLVNAVRGIVETTRHGQSGQLGDDRTRPLAEAFWG